MHSDPIADFMIRIKNGYMAKRLQVSAPYSKVKDEISKILVREGYVTDAKHEGGNMVVTLKYEETKPVLIGVKRISKPGLRVYVNKRKVPSVRQGYGMAIISTPQGLVTDKEARKKGIGGELMVKVW